MAGTAGRICQRRDEMSGARGVRMEPLGGRVRQGVERRRNSLDKPVAIGRCLQMCPVAEQEL